jgi:hypothetical protein
MTQQSMRVHGNWAALSDVLQVTVCTFGQINLADTRTTSLDNESLGKNKKH